MNKQEVIDSMIRLATEFNHPNLDDEYYLLAELYRTLDQYCIDNDMVVCIADRWI